MAKLILIRHGQSLWNARNKFTGWVDVPLSKKEGYSELLASFLSEKHIYRPHLTVGHLPDTNAAKIAMKELKHFDRKFETKVNKITTEIILEDLSSKVDFEIKLK